MSKTDVNIVIDGDNADLSYLAGLNAAISSYLSVSCQRKVEEAFRYAWKAHAGQFRKSGEPYITHPIAVAEIIARWRLDTVTIIAALLHDVVEDTPTTKQEVAEKFGIQVSELVDGVSKLDKVLFNTQEQAQAENIRKIFVAMVSDVRVILIKLADRMHNMNTLKSMRPDKRWRIAKETLDIYAPIANRLGIHKVYQRLCDLSLRYRFPYRALVIEKALSASRNNRREGVRRLMERFTNAFKEENLNNEIFGQEKSTYSIYRKMREEKITFSEVLDVYSFRISVDTVLDCYLALGILHRLYPPIPGKIKDYIALPKSNGYQSLHTTVIGPVGVPVKIQICTHEMLRAAEYGILSLWLYRDSDVSFADIQRETEKWLQSMMEMEAVTPDSKEFLENVKVALQPKQIYVITPKGQVYTLPQDSTPIDFAYAIHTDVGHHCVGCKINSRAMSLRTPLKNGDRVEIITSELGAPRPSWLIYAKTAKARSEIRHYLRGAGRNETIAVGRRLLGQIIRSYGRTPEEMAPALDQLIVDLGLDSRDELFLEIGMGRSSAAVIAQRLMPEGSAHAPEEGEEGVEPKPKSSKSVLIREPDGVAIQLAKCCHPIPGDAIVGSLHKARTLVIHALDCPKAAKGLKVESSKWMATDWDMDNVSGLFDVTLRVSASNRPGVLAKVAEKIGDAGANINFIHFEPTHGQYAQILFTVQVMHRIHLANVMRLIRRLPEVRHIQRVRFPKSPNKSPKKSSQ